VEHDGWVQGCFLVIGIVGGMMVNEADEISQVNNFIITPMVFFSGSFFLLTQLPDWLSSLTAFLPIVSINKLLRSPNWTNDLL